MALTGSRRAADEASTMPEPRGSEATLPLQDPGKTKPPDAGMRDRRERRWPWPLLAGALFGLGGLVGLYLVPAATQATRGLTAQTPGTQVEGAAAPEANALDIVALGTLQPDGGTLALALPSGAGDARIARLLVEEGDAVATGDTVAELDNMPALRAAKAMAQASLAAEQAALDQVRATSLSNLVEARAAHLAAEAALKVANEAFARQQRLASSNVTTAALVEQAQGNAIKAEAEFDRSAALVQRYAGAETGHLAEIVQAERAVDLARASLDRAIIGLAAGRVVAPRAGVVLEIHARVGERPSDAGVLTIGNTARMTAELEVYQTDIGAVARGASVTLTAAALGAPLQGRVSRIGRTVGRQSVMSSEPAANADARVVRVTVALDDRSSARASGYTNLEIIGRIGRDSR